MSKINFTSIIVLFFVASVGIFGGAKAEGSRQIPTVAIPTVTGTPSGATATVTMEQDQINVRAGPSTDYPIVGVLIAGQVVPALGRSVGGNWVQIAYPGAPEGIAWVYSPLVELSGSLPVVAPPPTPTPRTTPTIDPTLAAQFIVEIPPTRLPTYTEAAPMVIPTISALQIGSQTNRIPMGFIIIGLAIIGIFGSLISLLRGR